MKVKATLMIGLAAAALLILMFSLAASAYAVSGNGEQWFIRASNIDDSAYMYVNGVKVGPDVQYGGDSGWVDITSYVNSTQRNTNIRFLLWNNQYGYTYTFEIARKFSGSGEALTVVASWSAGQAGVRGARNNDQSRTYRWVFDSTVSLGAVLGDNFGSPTDTYPTARNNGWEGFDYLNWFYAGKYHSGADLNPASGAWQGANVRATANGKIIYRGYSSGWGNTIIMSHSFGSVGTVYSQYSHLSSFTQTIPMNRNIGRGTVIGYVGNTGGDYATHLHFEIKRPNAGGSLLGGGYYSSTPSAMDPRYLDPYSIVVGY